MINATAVPLADGWLFECAGHAGFGEQGRDIVCAGVSALCMALESTVEELNDEGCAEEVRQHTADGYYSAEVHWPDGDLLSQAKLETAIAMVRAGLSAIEALYPEHVQLND